MRVVVLILALLGTVASGFLGYKWYSDANSDEIKAMRALAGAASGSNARAKAQVEKFDKLVIAAYCLLGVSALGLVGGLMGYTGKKYVAASLLLLPAAVPAVLAMQADSDIGTGVLIFCSPLLLAGLLCFTIRSKPKAARAEGAEEQPKRGGKRGKVEVEEVEEPVHAADEDAEAAFAALEMEGDEPETEAAPATAEKEPDHEEDIDFEAAVADKEEQVDLESAAAPEEETSDHEPVAAATEEEDLAATLFEQPKPAVPRRIDKFVCPSCDTFLKASAPLPLGKPFNCPKCREAVTVTARA